MIPWSVKRLFDTLPTTNSTGAKEPQNPQITGKIVETSPFAEANLGNRGAFTHEILNMIVLEHVCF